MLARLQGVAGVRACRVEASGYVFWIEADEDGPDLERRVVEALGPGARRLVPEEAAAQLAARSSGERWYGPEDVRALSYLEGRVVTARAVSAVAAALALDRAASERLEDSLREEVFAVLERMHEEGLPGVHFFEAWPGIASRAARSWAAAGTSVGEGAIAEALDGLYRRAGRGSPR